MKLIYEKGDKLQIIPLDVMPEDATQPIKDMASRYVVVEERQADYYQVHDAENMHQHYNMSEKFFNMTMMTDFMSRVHQMSLNTANVVMGMYAMGVNRMNGGKKMVNVPNGRQCLMVAAIPKDMEADYLRRMKGFEAKLDTGAPNEGK